MIGSPADVAESFISLLDKSYGFKEERLRRFEERRVGMSRRMKVIGFLEFLALGIHEFTFRLIFHQVNFGFQFRVGFEISHMLIIYANCFKNLNKSKVTLLVTEVSRKG